MVRALSSVLILVGLLAFPVRGGADAAETPTREAKGADVVYVPTPNDVVMKMLEMAHVTKNDLVYDLGCGDGRIVVLAAKKYGCKGAGYDIDPQRIKECHASAKKYGVESLVNFEQKNVFTLDLSKANVVTLYLLPDLNVQLIPQLQKLKPGARVVSHDFSMKGLVTPDKVETITSKEDNVEHTLFLWTAPLKKVKGVKPEGVGEDEPSPPKETK